MGKRREGREAAVQFLFAHDLGDGDPKEDLPAFWTMRESPSAVRAFAENLILGTLEHRDEADRILMESVQNYQIHRIAAVDRNILRLAIFEMLHCAETPPVVAINEAIEIAKRFGSEESGRFVNGILDRIRGTITRPARTADTTPGGAPAVPPPDEESPPAS